MSTSKNSIQHMNKPKESKEIENQWIFEVRSKESVLEHMKKKREIQQSSEQNPHKKKQYS